MIDKLRFIDKSGAVVIPFEYGLTRLGFSNGLAKVYKNGKWGLINENNEFVIPPELDYSDILYCPEWDMLQVRIGQYGNYRYGFIDRDGTVKVLLVYKSAMVFPRAFQQPDLAPFVDSLIKMVNGLFPFSIWKSPHFLKVWLR